MNLRINIIQQIVVASLSLFSIILSAQNNNFLKEVVVNPPNAASFAKYGDIPVGYHTGVPNVSIPIHSLQDGKVSTSISLSYHASGIKVSEIASWVGLGWNLNANGAIVRTVRNAPDEGSYAEVSGIRGRGWYMNNGTNIADALGGNANINKDAYDGRIDTEADMFSFNFGGYSGKFYFKENQSTPTLVSEQDIKIEPLFGTSTFALSKSFDQWLVTTPDGTKYYFGEKNKAELTGADKAVDIVVSSGKYSPQGDRMVSAWYLTRIESYDGKNAIDFTYKQEKYAYKNLGTYVAFSIADYDCPVKPAENAETSQVISEVLGAKLIKIATSNSSVSFQSATTTRKDLDDISLASVLGPMGTGADSKAYPLEYIIIQDSAGNCLKKFKLETDYFQSDLSGFNAVELLEPNPKDIYRLRLNRVIEKILSYLK